MVKFDQFSFWVRRGVGGLLRLFCDDFGRTQPMIKPAEFRETGYELQIKSRLAKPYR
jgi:hypothetical protein